MPFERFKSMSFRSALKNRSTSSPTMSLQLETPKTKLEEVPPTSSKSRQKKFNRHFPAVDADEKVLNYYSCAFIGDILLQGNLYITKNYFAFYSNVFGYVTKLLIPIRNVQSITKEKTARIIPNAIGIATADEKHIFGSLLSRDNTFKFMMNVWEMSKQSSKPPEVTEPETVESVLSDSDSSVNKEGDVSGVEANLPEDVKPKEIHNIDENKENGILLDVKQKLYEKYKIISGLPIHILLLISATVLLIFLFISATILIHRISKVHDEYSLLLDDHDLTAGDVDLKSYLVRLRSKSAESVHDFVDQNLIKIARIREDLEILSALLTPKDSAKKSSDGS